MTKPMILLQTREDNGDWRDLIVDIARIVYVRQANEGERSWLKIEGMGELYIKESTRSVLVRLSGGSTV